MDDEAPIRTHADRGNLVWRLVWRTGYMVVRRLGPFVRLLGAMGTPGYEHAIVELGLVGRRSGRPRPVLVTLIGVDGNIYVGHPNGPRAWLANLAAADSVAVRGLDGTSVNVRGVALGLGHERDGVIRATPAQQPWPGSMLYWAAQRHILRAGIYYRLEPLDNDRTAPD